MGKIDTEAKSYLSNNERFCDVFNFCIYHGKSVITPDGLNELDTTALAIPYGNKARKHVQKHRDLLKLYAAKQDKGAIYLILGLEIETKIHYGMPVRAMLYDAMSYTHQVQLITEQRREVKPKQTYHEFLSGLGKEDRLKPVITIVLNLSGKSWDGCKSLHELLAVKDEQLLQFIPDYRLNLLSPDLLDEQDFDKFRTSLGAAMQFIKHQHDDDMNWMLDQKRMESVDRITADFIQTATGVNLHLKENDEAYKYVQSMGQLYEASKRRGHG